jgi:glucose-1-phosphate cytidylyltransferase
MDDMKVAVLCGGMGTRLREETEFKPKPMVEIGGRPILWHIMNIYGHFGYREFVLALGYKGEMIKEYFLNYHRYQSNLTIDLGTGDVTCASTNNRRDWNVHLVDTGLRPLTGGRLHRLEGMLDKTFMLTYGDGLGNVDVKRLAGFHRSHGKIATVTAVRPAARFGGMSFEGDRVVEFKEKPQTGEGWINGGFFVFEPEVFKYLHGDDTVLEGDPLENLARDGQLMAYRHEGFWQCMDTLRDREVLENFWADGDAPWKVWKD